MRVIDLALKDLSQIVRDWKAAAFLVVMPVAFTLLFGFVFSGTGGETDDPRLPVGFVDQDSGNVLGMHLLELLNASDAIRPVMLENADLVEVENQVREGDLAAALIVLAGYSEQVLVLAVDTAKPTLILDENSTAAHAAQTELQSVMARLLGAVQAARLSAQTFEARGGAADQQFLEESLVRAIEAWQDPPLTVAANQSSAAEEEETPPIEPNNFAHSSAGIMVQFAMAGLIGAAEVIVLERKAGALRRLLTTAISRTGIILGHYLAMFVMIFVQLAILVAFGQIVLGVPYMHAPLATLLMMVVTALWAASLGLLIGIVGKTEEQVIIFTLVTMLALSGLGGAWMPLEFTSPAFQTVGHLTPVAWAIDGFENIVIRGLGLESVLLPAVILLGFTLAFVAIAMWRFRFE